MVPLQALSLRFRCLAFWLSLLALCAALIAPVSVLAEEMRTGRWIGLCGASLGAGQAGQPDSDGSHCDLCALPALGLPPEVGAFAGLETARIPLALPVEPLRIAFFGSPSIRGPPFMS